MGDTIEIIPGIFQLKLPIPVMPSGPVPMGEVLSYINVYLVEGNAGWLLVDTGWDAVRVLRVFKEGLKAIGITFKEISKIVVTHVHLDHFGLAGKLKELSGAKLSLHQMEMRLIEQADLEAEQVLQQMKGWLYKHGTPEKEIFMLQKIPQGPMKYTSSVFPDAISFIGKIGFPDIFLSGGERIRSGIFNLEVLWTPGHSAGHICLYERARKVLISGDHILPDITPAIIFNPYSRNNPLGDYIGSLNKLKNLDVELILPGHGNYFTDFHGRIDELIRHHEERKRIILEVVKEMPKVAYQVSSEIPWMPERGGIPWDKLDPWSHRLALMETLAHLKILEKEGRVKRMYKANLEFYCGVQGKNP